MEKISIIIPIYNAQNYIGRCIESIVSQTYRNLEIICVDDGSTDLSGQICNEYKEIDERVVYCHIPNGGVGRARNHGLSIMSGKWFAFVDADDWIEPNYFEKLHKNAEKYNCTISACTYQKNWEYTKGYESEKEQIEILSSSNDCIKNFICSDNSMEGMVWNKLYLSELYGDIRFEVDIKVNEDCLYTYEIMKKCDRACWCSLPMYHWFMRNDSACHTKKIQCDLTPANVFLRLYEETKLLSDEVVEVTLKRNYIYAVIKILRYSKYDKSNQEILDAKKRCKQWRKNAWKMFSNKMKILYIIEVIF